MERRPERPTRSRPSDRIMTGVILAAGGTLVLIVIAIFYFLASESRYAFDRKFDYGFRVALQPETGGEPDLALDVNASLLTANREGADGLDEKEEGIEWPTLEMLAGAPGFGTGSTLGSGGGPVYRDDWRSMKRAEQGDSFTLYGFANAEYKFPRMVLAWQPDAAFDPALSPFDLKLRLKSAPSGVEVEPFEIDIRAKPKGRVLIPTYVAKTDDARTKGYEFEMVATPRMGQVAATLQGFFRTSWDPTLSYPRYGMVPLLLGTLLITLIAVAIAAPLGIGAAVYLSEAAPPRLREWLKPLLELLASVPTVVLGFLGLMLVAPWVQRTIAEALGLDSGRSLLTTALIMAVLLLPTITTVAEDAMRSVPQGLRTGGEALGLTAGENLRKVLLPAAKSGLVAALLLGVARAVGETMIVWVLSGGTPTMPSFQGLRDTASNLVRPTRGVPDTVAIEMGNVAFEEVHYGHLFLLGLTLFLITLGINLAAQRIVRRAAWRA